MRAFLLLLTFAVGSPFVFADKNDLYTNTFTVPPTFLNSGNTQQSLVDPFANVRLPEKRKTAKEILAGAGITFGVGASAIYNPGTSQLIVRNTQDQMELVEAYIESITQGVEKQIYVTVNEVQFDEEDLKESWVNQLDPKFQGVFELPRLDKPTGKSRAVTFDSPDLFRKEFSSPPSIPSDEGERVGRKVTGVLTDPQFQLLIRELNEQKGFQVLNLPSVMCRSGQLAMVQVDDMRHGIQVVLGADDFTVDLSLFLPLHGEALFDELDAITTPHKVTIWDGQTVVIGERRENGKCRFVFVKAQIMDPAGNPIHRRNERGKKKGASREAPEWIEPEPKRVPKTDFGLELQERVKKSDEAALRGSQHIADRDYRSGFMYYETALEILPEHELTAGRRKAYEKQFSRVQLLLAAEVYGGQDFEERIVEKGETLFQIAKDSNSSVKMVSAANRLKDGGLEVGQKLIVPRKVHDFEDSLKTIIIPSVDFRDVPLDDALGQILVNLHKNADRGLFPNFNPKISIEDAEKIGNPEITLRLSNVPAIEALRYVTSLAQCKFRVEDEVIVVVPLIK